MAAAQRHSYETAPPTRLTAPRISEARAAPSVFSAKEVLVDSLGLQLSNYAARCWFGCRCRQGCWRRRRRPQAVFENETRDPIPLPSSIEHRSRVDFGGDGLHASALVGLRRLVDRAVHLTHLRPLDSTRRNKQRPESTHLAPLPLWQHSTRKCGVSRAQCANRAAVLPARAERAVRADLLHVVLERHVLPLELLLKLCQLRVLHHIPRVVLLPRHRPPRMKLEALPTPPRIP